jgi:DNA invertase Pin-like site-specific DNA recombinase
MICGCARVSTDGQSVEAQVAALTAAGAVTVYREVASGAKTDRAQLRQVLAKLAAGDVLLVTRLDCLARSTRDLLNTLAAITGTGAGFISLGMPGPTPRRRTEACCSRSSAAWPSSNAS